MDKQRTAQPSEEQYKLSYRHTDAEGECVLHEIKTIRRNCLKSVLFWIASVAFIGIPLLLIHWFPKLERIFFYDFATYEDCTHVLIINFDDEPTICAVGEEEVFFDEVTMKVQKVFMNRYLRYFIDDKKVAQVQLFDFQGRLKRISSTKDQGLVQGQVQDLQKSYGKGAMEIQRPHCHVILFKEMTRPLFIFLFFSVALWYYEEYTIYASIILVTSALAITISVAEILTLHIKIHSMAFYQIQMNVLRQKKVVQVSSIEVVPGDIVFLKDPIKIPFEGIIIEGSALINECALTGESVPIVKKADVLQHYTNSEEIIDKSAYVYEGTSIVQVNSNKKMALFESTREAFGIPVCVTRTNFLTLKGQLIRIILFPKEKENIFQKESAKFLLVLFCIAVVTYIGMIPKLQETVNAFDLFIKFLDLITITVPPALPISMALGVVYAIKKLKAKQIYCIENSRVITGGVVNFCCFDKTGTLTQDFMDFQALVPSHEGLFYERIRNRSHNKINIEQTIQDKPYLYEIFNNMASNHSIIRIEETGELVGDPMEIKLFEFGDFRLNQSNPDPNVIFSFDSTRNQTGEIFRRFEFDSDLQRMSVVTKNKQNNNLYSYAKGSPEMMATLMNKKSIPSDYNLVLKQYASNGFRVLAIASKRLPALNHKEITREIAESDLSFDGFEVFENKLKPETRGAISELKEAEIGVVMITGDNPLTGSNIGYKCGISFKSKGMLICDYKGGHFCQQKFIYNEKDEESEITKFSLELSQEKPEDMLNEHFQKSNRVKLPPLNIEMLTNEKLKLKNKVSNQTLNESQQSTDEYMKSIIERAKQTNSQLCITGNAFNQLFQGKVEEISTIKRELLGIATVFARTKPQDKAKIVMVYQHTGKTVSMCGDGANDCGALKQADIGLSLAQTEASMSAPFTSQITNISSMVQLLKQCRAGLATNFSLFNVMASYSLTQYTTSIIDQIYYSYPADLHYLYWDLACNFFFIIVFGFTGTAEKLSVATPNNSLFCVTNIFQILFYFAFNVIGQICMILALSGAFLNAVNYDITGGMENNRATYIKNDDWSLDTPETNILFLFTNFLYLFTMLAFNIGRPWRKSFYTNVPFMVIFVIIIIYTILIVVLPASRLAGFNIIHIDDSGLTWFILGISLAFGIVFFVIQKFFWEPLSIYVRERYPDKTWL